MKFAVVGGDLRSVLLCSMLAGDGHRVYTYALERAKLPEEIPKAGCLQGCVYGADCVVLPVPVQTAGLLNAPYASEPLCMSELISVLWPGQILFGGKFECDSCLTAISEGLRVVDIVRSPAFAVENAALTAEGALELMMQNSERAILGSSVLITGWGRIGRILALRLAALGARVTVAARDGAQRAEAAVLGIGAVDYTALEGCMSEFSFIVNTVPARVLTDAMLCLASEGTVILELASPPGGFNRALAENIGLVPVYAPGLPGKSAPYSAAELIKGAIYRAINEHGG